MTPRWIAFIARPANAYAIVDIVCGGGAVLALVLTWFIGG